MVGLGAGGFFWLTLWVSALHGNPPLDQGYRPFLLYRRSQDWKPSLSNGIEAVAWLQALRTYKDYKVAATGYGGERQDPSTRAGVDREKTKMYVFDLGLMHLKIQQVGRMTKAAAHCHDGTGVCLPCRAWGQTRITICSSGLAALVSVGSFSKIDVVLVGRLCKNRFLKLTLCALAQRGCAYI